MLPITVRTLSTDYMHEINVSIDFYQYLEGQIFNLGLIVKLYLHLYQLRNCTENIFTQVPQHFNYGNVYESNLYAHTHI